MLARSYIRVTCGLQLPPVGESGAAAAALLGGDADESRLREVMIAGERLRQAQTAHDDKTGGVDQRPLLVAILLQQRPGCRVQIRIDVYNLRDLLHFTDKLHALRTAEACANREQSVQLRYDVVRGDGGLSYCVGLLREYIYFSC